MGDSEHQGAGMPPPGWPGGDPRGGPPQGPSGPGLAAIGDAKMWAYLSYLSMFIGFPLFIVPMIQRDNEFALFHAKQAGAAFIVAMLLGSLVGIVAAVTCGAGIVLLPVVFLPMVPVVHGLQLVSQEEMREPALMFGAADLLFGGLRVDRTSQLSPPVPPPDDRDPAAPPEPPDPSWGGS